MGNMVCSEIDKLILFGIRKNCLIRERSPLYLFIDEAIKVVLVIRHNTYQLHTTFYAVFFMKGAFYTN